MSSFIIKFVAQRLLKDNQWNRIGVEDPYYELIPIDDRYGKVKYKKIARKAPEGITEKDLKVLNQFKKKAYRYDMWFKVCGVSFGWSNIIGLIPVVGSIISTYWSLRLLLMAKQLEDGLPLDLQLLFLLNIIIDLVIGLIPIVGDLIVIGYKSNSRNYSLLEKHLVRVGQKCMGLIDEKDVRPNFVNDKIQPIVENKIMPGASKAGEEIKSFINRQLYASSSSSISEFNENSISATATTQTTPTTVTSSSVPNTELKKRHPTGDANKDELDENSPKNVKIINSELEE